MASKDATEAGRSVSPVDDSFPNPGSMAKGEPTGPPSIISSRMTDIASDDGGENAGDAAASRRRQSNLMSDTASRPGTAKTGTSSARLGGMSHSGSFRRPGGAGAYVSSLAAKRGSMAPSIAGSVSGGATSRSHVPSLTSHAFFHPMSSQRLQAQRSGQRASTIGQPPPAPPGDDAMTDDGRTTVPAQQRQSTASQPQQMGARLLARPLTDDNKNNNGDLAQSPPQSRGTEMTEQETIDRVTANTSPTHGHNPTASITESMRPLQQKTPAAGGSSKKGGLSVNVGGSGSGAAGGGTLPPLKSPRSFRSSFLLPGKGGSGAAGAGGGDGAVNGSNRSTQGAEKLSSAASSPKLQPADDGRGKNGKLSKNKSASPKAANLGRNWEYFEGNTAFGLGGRWQNARSRPINIVTGLFAVMPIVLFCVFSARFLWYNISPAIPITFGYVSFLCLSSFLHASVSDPGILPRNLHRFPPVDPDEDPLTLGPPTTEWTLIKSAESSAAAMEVPTKFCKTCNIWRPPRCHHCRVCDNCIETQDHHCVWINNCVGRRNYRYFFAFLTTATLLGLYVIGGSLAHIFLYMNQEDVSFGTAIDHLRVPFAMVIYGFVAMLYPLALLGYHLFLMGRGETTREFLNSHKLLKKDRYRAFTQGSVIKNWTAVLCRPRPPTYYQFKRRFVGGDQRFGTTRRRDKAAAAQSEGSNQGLEMQDIGRYQPGFQGPARRAVAPGQAGSGATGPSNQ